MNVKYRDDWTFGDFTAVEHAMDEFQFGNKSWQGAINRTQVYHTIAHLDVFQVCLVSGYLLAYDICVPWYSAGDLVLYEHLLLKVDPAAHNIRPVLRAMDSIARLNGCVGIAVGTALNTSDERLARVYHRAGYRTQAHALYKEMT